MKEEEEGQKEYEEKEYRGRIKNMKQKKKKERKNRAGEEKKSFNIKGTITKPSPHFTAHLKLGKVGNQGTKACLLHGGKRNPPSKALRTVHFLQVTSALLPILL